MNKFFRITILTVFIINQLFLSDSYALRPVSEVLRKTRKPVPRFNGPIKITVDGLEPLVNNLTKENRIALLQLLLRDYEKTSSMLQAILSSTEREVERSGDTEKVHNVLRVLISVYAAYVERLVRASGESREVAEDVLLNLRNHLRILLGEPPLRKIRRINDDDLMEAMRALITVFRSHGGGTDRQLRRFWREDFNGQLLAGAMQQVMSNPQKFHDWIEILFSMFCTADEERGGSSNAIQTKKFADALRQYIILNPSNGRKILAACDPIAGTRAIYRMLYNDVMRVGVLTRISRALTGRQPSLLTGSQVLMLEDKRPESQKERPAASEEDDTVPVGQQSSFYTAKRNFTAMQILSDETSASELVQSAIDRNGLEAFLIEFYSICGLLCDFHRQAITAKALLQAGKGDSELIADIYAWAITTHTNARPENRGVIMSALARLQDSKPELTGILSSLNLSYIAAYFGQIFNKASPGTVSALSVENAQAFDALLGANKERLPVFMDEMFQGASRLYSSLSNRQRATNVANDAEKYAEIFLASIFTAYVASLRRRLSSGQVMADESTLLTNNFSLIVNAVRDKAATADQHFGIIWRSLNAFLDQLQWRPPASSSRTSSVAPAVASATPPKPASKPRQKAQQTLPPKNLKDLANMMMDLPTFEERLFALRQYFSCAETYISQYPNHVYGVAIILLYGIRDARDTEGATQAMRDVIQRYHPDTHPDNELKKKVSTLINELNSILTSKIRKTEHVVRLRSIIIELVNMSEEAFQPDKPARREVEEPARRPARRATAEPAPKPDSPKATKTVRLRTVPEALQFLRTAINDTGFLSNTQSLRQLLEVIIVVIEKLHQSNTELRQALLDHSQQAAPGTENPAVPLSGALRNPAALRQSA
ncbi:MAG: hypothetical protein JW946_01365 [Candidatus Omnitrophica bacterium]|nr:hypothetical protein [Candidatus Omnitrophota bacterium]